MDEAGRNQQRTVGLVHWVGWLDSDGAVADNDGSGQQESRDAPRWASKIMIRMLMIMTIILHQNWDMRANKNP